MRESPSHSIYSLSKLIRKLVYDIYLKFIICRLSFFAIPGPSLLLVVVEVEVVVCVFVSVCV